MQEYADAVRSCLERVDRLTGQIRQLYGVGRLGLAVEVLQALRGISLIVAATAVAPNWVAWSCRFPARVSRRLRDSQETLPQSVLEIAWKAQVRLCARYQRLIAKGEQSQIAVTAVARELAGFMRVIARTVLVPV